MLPEPAPFSDVCRVAAGHGCGGVGSYRLAWWRWTGRPDGHHFEGGAGGRRLTTVSLSLTPLLSRGDHRCRARPRATHPRGRAGAGLRC